MYDRWNIALKSLCLVFNVPFQSVLEAVLQTGEEIIKYVHAVVCDLPYNNRWIAELSNSKQDWLSLQEMWQFV